MKRIIFYIFLLLTAFNLSLGTVYSATPTSASSPTSSPEGVQRQLDDLKERIASRVAELNLVEKRGIIGEVSDVTNTQINLTDIKNDTRFVDVDELTKFFSDSSDSFGISDIKKGETLGILGLYNKESRRLLARSVDVLTNFVFINGAVNTIDAENFTLKIVDENQKEIEIDNQTTTRNLSFTKDGGLVRSGFSKIKQLQNIIVLGIPDKKDKNIITASKIIIFPDLPKNPKIIIVPEVNPTTIPSTGSGVKLTPIVK